MKIHAGWGLGSCLLVFLIGCSDEKAPECPSTGTTLTYTSFGHSFMDTYCASCHAASVTGTARQGAPTDQVFDTLAQVRAKSDDIMHEAVVEKEMPYGSASKKPTDAERAQLGEWLACGAPE